MKQVYQYIHTDLIGLINLTGFGGERYFFTFTDDFSRYTKIFTGSKKSDWFKCIKNIHNFCKNRFKERYPVEWLRIDYDSELQSKAVNEWLIKESITFKHSSPYSQEQNGVSKRTGRTIMDVIRTRILEESIYDKLRPKIVLAMTYIKNVQLTKALQGDNPYQAQF